MVGLVSCTKLLLYNNAYNSAGHVSNPRARAYLCVWVCVCVRVHASSRRDQTDGRGLYHDVDAIAAALHVPLPR